MSYKKLKLACYISNVTMAVVSNIPPILLLTFRTLYGLSYSMMGLLVLLNFSTQLIIDLVFSFFSHKFNITKTVKLMPLISIIGFAIYAASPLLFYGSEYVGLMLGTIVFSAASGLGEVLVSPIISAVPADDPDKEMSKLHSVYAWGSAAIVVLGTLMLYALGREKWQIVVLLFTLIPLSALILFLIVDIPKVKTPERISGTLRFIRDRSFWACVFAIFLGGAAECTMAQWASGYLEISLGIAKVWGDIFGVALFGISLGIGRSLHAKRGGRIKTYLVGGSGGAAVCYLVAALSPFPIISLVACAATGFFVSMLWPGNLIVASDRFSTGGVFIYAMMAAGGDLGASLGPQFVGGITDIVSTSSGFAVLSADLGMTVEQLGIRLGMLMGMVFPFIAIFVCNSITKNKKSQL